MEDVLAVSTRPRDPDRRLVCLDETSKQLIAETRMPIPMKRGRPARPGPLDGRAARDAIGLVKAGLLQHGRSRGKLTAVKLTEGRYC